MDHRLQAVSDAAALAQTRRVAQIVETAASVRPMGERILERYAPVISEINAQTAATINAATATTTAAQAAMVSVAAQQAARAAASVSTGHLPLTGIVESLRASLPSNPAILDSLNVTTPALDAVTQFSLGTEALGAALNLIRTGEIDYEEVVEGLDIREAAEAAATEAVGSPSVTLPRDDQLDLHQAAALIYVLTWILLVYGITPEPVAAHGVTALALLSGEGGRIYRNLAPAPRRESD
ncbi:MAG: hypothetical protein ACTHVO_09415 [Brevibacterium yomogidense]